MKNKLFLKLIQRAALLTGVIGIGAVAIAPARANMHENSQMEETSTYETSPTGENMGAEENSMPMESSDMSEDQSSNSVVAVAANSEQFSTLVKAIEAAELESTLQEGGPYTIFAPTDEAFAQLPDGALEFLLQPENQDLLKQVLTYHVVPAELTASEIQTGTVDALGGGLAVEADSDGVTVNNARVIEPDIQAENGVIHAIDTVLIPPEIQEQLDRELGTSIY